MRKCLAYHVLDQDERTTSSLGIYHYSVGLLRAMATRPDPGFDLVVLASAQNVAAFTPPVLPSWMSVRVIPGRHATGCRRLWSDQVIGPRAARACGAQAVFYPKGFIPLFPPRGLKLGANIHDTIVFHYAEHHPGHVPALKLAYFKWATKHTLRFASWISTDSHHSQRDLARIEPRAAGRLHTVYFGAGIETTAAPLPLEARTRTLVLGAKVPHKATRETLELLGEMGRRSGHPRPVDVTGLSEWPSQWGLPPQGLDLRFRGRLSATDLAEAFRQARVLVLLSTIEGFGLPLLEAYAAGTPVCYRDSTSLGELMERAPGGWDGRDANSFQQALAAAEALSAAEIESISTKLKAKTDWGLAAQNMTGLFQKLLA